MNAAKDCLKITIVASLVPVIVGLLMFTLSRAADEKAVGKVKSNDIGREITEDI